MQTDGEPHTSAKCPGTPDVCKPTGNPTRVQSNPLTILAATRGGAQDGPILATVEGVAVAVEGVMETSEMPGRN